MTPVLEKDDRAWEKNMQVGAVLKQRDETQGKTKLQRQQYWKDKEI